jgi:hypothetical protein
MKKTILISGIICVNLFVFGALMKVMHWPGAGIALTVGIVSFSMWFLPTAIINSYRGSGKTKTSLYVSGFICAFICAMGALWKVQHWPGAGWFLLVGVPLPFVLFLPVYIYHHNKEKNKTASNFAGVMFLLIFVAVFSGLLALNVSRDILTSITNDATNLYKTNELLELKNKNVCAGNIDAKHTTEVAEIKKQADAICASINEIQISLVKAVDGAESTALSANGILPENIRAKDESVYTSFYMLGIEEDPGKAAPLKKSIATYREYLKSLAIIGKEQSEQIILLLSTSDKAGFGPDESTISWENWLFKNRYLITVIANLEDLKNKVRISETSVLSVLAADKENAKVVEKAG